LQEGYGELIGKDIGQCKAQRCRALWPIGFFKAVLGLAA